MCCSGDCWVCCIAELLNKKHLPSPELRRRVALAAINLMHAWCYSTGTGCLPAVLGSIALSPLQRPATCFCHAGTTTGAVWHMLVSMHLLSCLHRDLLLVQHWLSRADPCCAGGDKAVMEMPRWGTASACP